MKRSLGMLVLAAFLASLVPGLAACTTRQERSNARERATQERPDRSESGNGGGGGGGY